MQVSGLTLRQLFSSGGTSYSFLHKCTNLWTKCIICICLRSLCFRWHFCYVGYPKRNCLDFYLWFFTSVSWFWGTRRRNQLALCPFRFSKTTGFMVVIYLTNTGLRSPSQTCKQSRGLWRNVKVTIPWYSNSCNIKSCSDLKPVLFLLLNS